MNPFVTDLKNAISESNWCLVDFKNISNACMCENSQQLYCHWNPDFSDSLHKTYLKSIHITVTTSSSNWRRSCGMSPIDPLPRNELTKQCLFSFISYKQISISSLYPFHEWWYKGDQPFLHIQQKIRLWLIYFINFE